MMNDCDHDYKKAVASGDGFFPIGSRYYCCKRCGHCLSEGRCEKYAMTIFRAEIDYQRKKGIKLLDFELLCGRLNAHIDNMLVDKTNMFVTSTDKDALYDLYLDSWPEGTNEIYRQRRYYDCSACRSFIRSFGAVVTLENGVMTSIWDVDTGDPDTQQVMDALANFVKAYPVIDVFVTNYASYGQINSIETLSDGTRIRHPHFYYTLPPEFVCDRTETPETVRGRLRDTRNVFKRSLDEISQNSVTTALELIAQNSLYRGKEWDAQLMKFQQYQEEYAKLPDLPAKELYAWEKSVEAGAVIGKIRNHSIGTFLVDVSAGMDIDTALLRYEKVVAPTNYKRPKAVFTKRMIEDAQKAVTDMGYLESLKRRYATLNDITANNILFINRDAIKAVKDTDGVFAKMASDVAISPKKFDRIEEVPIDKFIENVLPTATSIEVLIENRLQPNLMSLIAPQNPDARTMFKWDNNFSWAYAGNIADSMKELVKKAGGDISGVLRFSIKWNDLKELDGNDVDAHCITPTVKHIYFANKRCGLNGGSLDVDITQPCQGKPAVENITFPTLAALQEGKYEFFIECFAGRGGNSGFAAEIECGGQIHEYERRTPLKHKERVDVATVTYSRTEGFTVKNNLPSNISSHDVWGLKTNTFAPVSTIMHSPNYWNAQYGIGNKHVFFMLKDCVNPENPNGFFNEFLNNGLMKHKRVFEALGSEMKVNPADDQLSGLGFCMTQRNNVVCKVTGATERTLKVVF